MTDKEKDAAKMLLVMNAVKYIVHGEPPVGPRLQVRREDMALCVMSMRSLSPEVMCIGGVLGYYTHGESPDGSAKQDYPSQYARVESQILWNEHFKDYLSAFADALDRSGDGIARQRLRAAGAYVESSAGKSEALSEFGISSSSGDGKTGCMVPVVLFIGAVMAAVYAGTRLCV